MSSQLPVVGRIVIELGLFAVAVFGAVNGFLMLVFPERWFDLPNWMVTRGGLTRDMVPERVRSSLTRVAGIAILFVVAFTLKAVFSWLIAALGQG